MLVVQIDRRVRQLLFDGHLDPLLALLAAPHFPILLGRGHGQRRGRIAQFIRSPSRRRLDILEVVLGLEAHRKLGQELQSPSRIELEHDILEVGVDVAVAILAVEDLPLRRVRISRAGEVNVVQLDTAFQFGRQRVGQRGRHPFDADVLAGHERLVRPLAGVKHQVQRTSRLDARAVLTLCLQQGDLVDVLLRNPIRVRKTQNGIGLGDVKPVEGQIEANYRVLSQPFDQAQRLTYRTPPDLVKLDRPLFLGILQQHHHAVQPAGFRINVDLAHASYWPRIRRVPRQPAIATLAFTAPSTSPSDMASQRASWAMA